MVWLAGGVLRVRLKVIGRYTLNVTLNVSNSNDPRSRMGENYQGHHRYFWFKSIPNRTFCVI